MNSSDNSGDTADFEPEAIGQGQLAIKQTPDERGVTLTVAGELDISSAPELAAAISAIDQPGDGRVLLDLSGVEFIDSTGLACLIATDREARAHGYELHLRGLQGQVQMLFELTGLHDRFSYEA